MREYVFVCVCVCEGPSSTSLLSGERTQRQEEKEIGLVVVQVKRFAFTRKRSVYRFMWKLNERFASVSSSPGRKLGPSEVCFGFFLTEPMEAAEGGGGRDEKQQRGVYAT